LRITKPSGSYVDISLGDYPIKEELDITDHFDETGVYTLTISADSIGRIRWNLYGKIYLGIRVR